MALEQEQTQELRKEGWYWVRCGSWPWAVAQWTLIRQGDLRNRPVGYKPRDWAWDAGSAWQGDSFWAEVGPRILPPDRVTVTLPPTQAQRDVEGIARTCAQEAALALGRLSHVRHHAQRILELTGERRQGDGTGGEAESPMERDRRTAPAPYVSDHLPLTREELRQLLLEARMEYHSQSDAETGRKCAALQERLRRAIPGMTDPIHYDSEAGRRLALVDGRFVNAVRYCPVSEPMLDEFMCLLSPEPLPRLWTREGQREQQEEARQREERERWARQARVREGEWKSCPHK